MENTNHGVIEDPRSVDLKMKDLVMGALPVDIRLTSGDWSPFYPKRIDGSIGEHQSNAYFDTMSCATFSALHTIETQVIWMLVNGKVPQVTVDWMKSAGYFQDPNDFYTLEFSKRASAIMNGTTPQGNYFQAVWDSARNDGLLPASKLMSMDPNTKTIQEYLDPTVITPLMRAEALAFLVHFSIQYELVQGYDSDGSFSLIEEVNTHTALLTSPIQIGIPVPCSHGEMMGSLGTLQSQQYNSLNTYIPFVHENDTSMASVAYAMKGYVTANPQPTPLSPSLFKRFLDTLRKV